MWLAGVSLQKVLIIPCVGSSPKNHIKPISIRFISGRWYSHTIFPFFSCQGRWFISFGRFFYLITSFMYCISKNFKKSSVHYTSPLIAIVRNLLVKSACCNFNPPSRVSNLNCYPHPVFIVKGLFKYSGMMIEISRKWVCLASNVILYWRPRWTHNPRSSRHTCDLCRTLKASSWDRGVSIASKRGQRADSVT